MVDCKQVRCPLILRQLVGAIRELMNPPEPKKIGAIGFEREEEK